MINNKGLITTFILVVLSTLYLGSVWNDFFGTLSVNVSMDRQQAVKAASDASKQFAILDDSFGGIDIIVNNAGYTWDNVIQKMDDKQWDAILECHLTAPFKILRAAQPHIKKLFLKEKENGITNFRKVVNISSTSGMFGNAGQINYATAKAGVVGMAKTMAKEWGRYNVNVNAVGFGLIKTRLTDSDAEKEESLIDIEGNKIKVGVNSAVFQSAKTMIPLGRPGTPQEAAGAIYMFCIPESNYVTGQILMCHGGGFGY